MSDIQCDACLYIRDIPESLLKRYQKSTLRISRCPYDISAVVRSCDIVISHVGHGTVASALLAGRPQLLVPLQVEQLILARRIVDLGVGITLVSTDRSARISAKLTTLLEDERIRRNARRFADRYSDMGADSALPRIVDRSEALLRIRDEL